MLKVLDQNNPTSVTLLAGLQAIDGAAWEEFVCRYSPAIHHWVRRRGVSEVDACDITQEVMFKLLSSLRDGCYDRSKGSFRAWLKTVVTNAVCDWFLRTKRYGEVLEQVSVSDLTDSIAGALEQEYRAELFERAAEIVSQRVQPHTWEAFRQTGIENLAVTEVAANLGVSVAQVYLAKNRVLKRMKVVVEELTALDGRLA